MASTWFQLGFQDMAYFMAQEMSHFHDKVNLVLIFILVFVGVLMAMSLFNKIIHKTLMEGQTLEAFWTIAPAFVLIQIAISSVSYLYMLEEFPFGPDFTVKITGHQWYWSYEYPQIASAEAFDSYMVPLADLPQGHFRLLEVDNRVAVPSLSSIRYLITSADVLHSWAIPSLSMKLDAVPGRLNQMTSQTWIAGLFYGQCSEICGANHSFMPIVLESIPAKDWVKAHSN